MGCHETLMARRRKKSKAAAAAKARDKEGGSPMMTEKSLPALPPEIAPASVGSGDADSDTPTSASPRPQAAAPRLNNSRIAAIPARSPERPSTDHGNNANKDTLTLPSSTYRKNRNSAILPSGHGSNQNDSPDGFYISVALDPAPGANGSSKTSAETANDAANKKPKSANERRSDSTASTPHIAFQEKGRQQSTDHITQAMAPSRHLSKSEKDKSKASPDADDARPEAPRSKRLAASRTNSSHSTDMKQANGTSRPRASQDSRSPEDEEMASPELHAKSSRSGPGMAIARKELPPSANRTRKTPLPPSYRHFRHTPSTNPVQ